MKGTISIKEAAKLWGISESRIAKLCREDRIQGAQKDGRSWLIPADTQRPADHRIKSGHYVRESRRESLPLPVGISDFRKASSDYYYVDKTLLIRDFLDERPMVSLFTRPRRFGKTLTLDMLRTFFEKTGEDTSLYFKDKKIWACGQRYRDCQGKYPVIFLTFKDVKFQTWEECLPRLAGILAEEFSRHGYLEGSEQCTGLDRAYFKKVLHSQASAHELTSALGTLSKMLHACHGIPPVILIDEYDTPIQQGYHFGFCKEAAGFLGNLFSGGLKDNPHLSWAILTGVLSVLPEGLDNVKVNSIWEQKYSEYFGFTAEEVRELAVWYRLPEQYDELNAWYGGYRFGNNDLFNPWSVINYFSSQVFREYWSPAGYESVISSLLSRENFEKLSPLLQKEPLLVFVDAGSLWGVLLAAGFLRANDPRLTSTGSMVCQVLPPNREVSLTWNRAVLSALQPGFPRPLTISIQEALHTGHIQKLRESLETLLLETISHSETFFDGLLLGLCALLGQHYRITAQRESAEGRYDLQLTPREKTLPGILIEVRSDKKQSDYLLKELAKAALQGISKRKYDEEMKNNGVSTIFRYGISLSEKRVEVISA